MPPTPAMPKLCSPPLPRPVRTLRTHLTMRFTHLLVRRSHRRSCSVTAPDLADVGRGLPGKAEAGAPGVDPALGLPHPTPRKTVALWPSVCVADVMSVFPRDNCQSVFLTCATAPICDSSQKQQRLHLFLSPLESVCSHPTQHLQRELPPATQMPFLTPTWVTSQGPRVASPSCERCQQRCRCSHSVCAFNRAQKAPEPDALRLRCRCVNISRMRRMPKMHDP